MAKAAALLRLALDYYREPLSYPHLTEVDRPLPRGFDRMLSGFCAALSPSLIEETAAKFETTPDQLTEAARFFFRHVLLDAGGDFYRHLGLNRDAGQDAIRHHYQLLIRLFHPDRVEPSSELGDLYATRINLAYQRLGDPLEREAYDRGLARYADGLTETDPAWFFRASRPMLRASPAAEFPGVRARIGRRSLAVYAFGTLSLVALVLGTTYSLIKLNQPPGLRVAVGGGEGRPAPLPSYLKPSGGAPGIERPSDTASAAGPLVFSGSFSAAPEPADPSPPNVSISDPLPANRLPLHDAPSRGAREDAPRAAGLPMPPAQASEQIMVSPRLDDARSSPPAPAKASEPLSEPLLKPVPEVEPLSHGEPVGAAQRPAPRAASPPSETKTSPPGHEASPKASTGLADGGTGVGENPMPKASSKPKQPGPDAIGSRSSGSPEQVAEALVARMEIAYGAKNADGVAVLFTKDARITGASGRANIRANYQDLFRRSAGAKLSITDVKWRAMPNERIVGSGRIAVSNQYHGRSGWRHAQGRVEFELRREAGEYRIAIMSHELD